MKTRLLFTLSLVSLLIIGCNDNDEGMTMFMGEEIVYDLGSVSNSAISGTATFIMNQDNSTTVQVQLSGTTL